VGSQTCSACNSFPGYLCIGVESRNSSFGSICFMTCRYAVVDLAAGEFSRYTTVSVPLQLCTAASMWSRSLTGLSLSQRSVSRVCASSPCTCAQGAVSARQQLAQGWCSTGSAGSVLQCAIARARAACAGARLLDAVHRQVQHRQPGQRREAVHHGDPVLAQVQLLEAHHHADARHALEAVRLQAELPHAGERGEVRDGGDAVAAEPELLQAGQRVEVLDGLQHAWPNLVVTRSHVQMGS
jgi:hypothetical protein